MKKIAYTFLFVLLILPACSRDVLTESGTDGDSAVSQTVTKTEPKTTVMEVCFTEELCRLVERSIAEGDVRTRSTELNEVLDGLGVVSMERIFPDAGEFEERSRKEGLHRFYRLTLSEEVPATRASASLTEIKGIESAVPPRRTKLDTFNDPSYSKQWQYYNSGSGSAYSSGCDINVQPAWDQFTTGDPKVVVAVVDGGIDFNHEDLADNYVGGYNFCSNNYSIVPEDHGTHVAGTIAAVNNNGIGVCGVAGGDKAAGQKGVSLMSIQTFEAKKGSDSAYAIKWSADHGANISQNSWGYDFDTDDQALSAANAGLAAYSPSLKAAIDYFIKYAGCDKNGNQKPDSPMKGGVFIMSAGNSNRNRDVICEYEPVISVGAVASNFNKAYYSNYGPWVDICAPGGDAQLGPQILSTVVGGYASMQGTSMACPHVSGVAALIVSYLGGPGFTNAKLKEKLLGGANAAVMAKTNERHNIGPLVNAFGSLTFGGTTPPQEVKNYTVTQKSNNLDFSWVVTKGSDGIRAYGYLLLATKDPALLKGLDPAAELPSGVIGKKVLTEGIKAGQTMTGRIGDLEFNTPYYTAIAGFNSNNYYSALTNSDGSATATTNPSATETGSNSSPVITVKGSDNITLKSHETGTFEFTAIDPDDHAVSMEFNGGSKAASCHTSDGVNFVATIDAPQADAGTYQFIATASDKYGASSSKSMTYTILENHAPEKIKDVNNILMSRIGETVVLNMEDYITDPDGETLKYSSNLSTTTNLKLTQTEGSIELRSTNFGETTVSMKGSDAKGKYCSLSFVVLARDPAIPIDVYPNPVVDILTIRPYKETSNVTVAVVSQAGAKVMEQSSKSSPFEPVKLDVSDLAPGKYVINISFDGESYQRTIVKQ